MPLPLPLPFPFPFPQPLPSWQTRTHHTQTQSHTYAITRPLCFIFVTVTKLGFIFCRFPPSFFFLVLLRVCCCCCAICACVFVCVWPVFVVVYLGQKLYSLSMCMFAVLLVAVGWCTLFRTYSIFKRQFIFPFFALAFRFARWLLAALSPSLSAAAVHSNCHSTSATVSAALLDSTRLILFLILFLI